MSIAFRAQSRSPRERLPVLGRNLRRLLYSGVTPVVSVGAFVLQAGQFRSRLLPAFRTTYSFESITVPRPAGH